MKLTPTWRNRLRNLTTIFLVLTVIAIIYTLIQWIRSEPGSFEPLNVLFFAVFSVASGVSAWLSRPDNVQPPASSEIALAETPAFGPLRQQISSLFSLEELRVLCLDLGIRYEALSGDTLDSKVASLLAYADRRSQLNKLMVALLQERPQVKWPIPNTLQTLYELRRNVRATWIDGVLKQSVTDEIALELNLTLDPHALMRKVAYVSGQADKPIEKEMLQLFTDFGSLLILGEPGSGKTMTLLQLAESFLNAGEQDAMLFTPVVLNLSSWANEQKPLREWLVEELWQQYQLPLETGQAIIQNNHLVYLLDGLDEVAQVARNACVQAINLFGEQQSGRLIVCCRVAEYEVLPHKLNLGMGIRIQPLDGAIVNTYLRRPGLGLETVHKLWQTDEALQKLAQTPLFLSVITMAYRGAKQEDLNHLNTSDAWQMNLYSHYISEMFRRRPLQNEKYHSEQAIKWLTNIAAKMKVHEQTIFYLERLQPTWLNANWQRSIYYRITNMVTGAILGLNGGLILALILALIISVFYWNLLPINLCLIGIILGGFSNVKNPIRLYEVLEWAPQGKNLLLEVKRWLNIGLSIGLSIGLTSALTIGLSGEMAAGIGFGVSIGLIIGLIGGRDSYIRISERMDSPNPNHAIRSSLKSGMQMALFYGFMFGIIFALSLGLNGGLYFGLVGGFLGGFVFGGNYGFFNYGGQSFIQHYILRWILAFSSTLPFSAKIDKTNIEFLDNMKDRILLRRVGGGWIFIHRTLLDYFASLNPDAQGEE